MELFIAILWYLQILMPGTTVEQADLDVMIEQNQAAIECIQQDAVLTENIMDDYLELDDPIGLVEEWEEEEEPIFD